jgi:mannose-6-phosphate isomerase-like protein (cupin superfamily)
MLTKSDQTRCVDMSNCHGGRGRLLCIELMADYAKQGKGIKFVHDDYLDPGATIGEHTHKDDEEIYIILDGEGEMLIDGQPHPVGPGDMCYTKPGHSHALHNGTKRPMRLIVVGVNA